MACRTIEHPCADCGRMIKVTNLRCEVCRPTDRICTGCGRSFRGAKSQCERCRYAAADPVKRAARNLRKANARRARKLAAEVTGPVSVDSYVAILASGPCVYCGNQATSVDHVRPLSQGGWEHESNLVPACKSCNSSKRDKFLTDWHRIACVTYGVAHSPKVAAEYRRLTEMAAVTAA